jgi:hypothetical protein
MSFYDSTPPPMSAPMSAPIKSANGIFTATMVFLFVTIVFAFVTSALLLHLTIKNNEGSAYQGFSGFTLTVYLIFTGLLIAALYYRDSLSLYVARKTLTSMSTTYSSSDLSQGAQPYGMSRQQQMPQQQYAQHSPSLAIPAYAQQQTDVGGFNYHY